MKKWPIRISNILINFGYSTLEALINYQKEFENVLITKDAKLLSDLIHKSTMSFYYIQADPLSELLKECRRILKEESDNHSLLKTNVKEIKFEFNTIIEGLKSDNLALVN